MAVYFFSYKVYQNHLKCVVILVGFIHVELEQKFKLKVSDVDGIWLNNPVTLVHFLFWVVVAQQ